jgi:hypothetical protein
MFASRAATIAPLALIEVTTMQIQAKNKANRIAATILLDLRLDQDSHGSPDHRSGDQERRRRAQMPESYVCKTRSP